VSAKVLLVLIVAILFTGSVRSGPSYPLGCADPDVMSKGLKNVSNRDWNEISETSLPSMWPTEISPIYCNAGACQTLGREDRIIYNKCECCEQFDFQVDVKAVATLRNA
jgi:hypothetical protein